MKHKYHRIKYDRAVVEQSYQDALKTYNSWSIEEREKHGFGKNGGHPHPRRLYIFLYKYFTEIKYFMSENERDKYVLPWVCATRSERLNALKKHKVYFDIKQSTLKLAKSRYECYKLDKEIKELRNEYK